MFSPTHDVLEKFDNQHEWERLCADLLNATGNSNVVPVAPRGGPDGGQDVTYLNSSGERGLACVSLRKDAKAKFLKDVAQRKAGEFAEYTYFTNQYLTADEKVALSLHCGNKLNATFIPRDIEGIRSLLDVSFQNLRKRYLNIALSNIPTYSFDVSEISTYSADQITQEAVNRHRKTAEEFQKHSIVVNAMPINIPALGVESTTDVLGRLGDHIDKLAELNDQLRGIYSFNLLLKSDSYDENIQVEVESSEDVKFSFEGSMLELPDIPSAKQRSAFDTILNTHYLYTPNFANVVAKNKDEFYAQLRESGKKVVSNISSLNPNQPKLLFDEPVFVLSLKSPKSISIKVTVYSKNLTTPQSLGILIDPQNAKIVQLFYTSTGED